MTLFLFNGVLDTTAIDWVLIFAPSVISYPMRGWQVNVGVIMACNIEKPLKKNLTRYVVDMWHFFIWQKLE